MPNLSIKNVPAPIVEKLRQRAARNRRSMQGELMALIYEAVGDVEPAQGAPIHPPGSRTVHDIVAEQNRRWTGPFTQTPRAVDMIREDRDAR